MEFSVTYPQAAVLYDVVKGAIIQIVVPGSGETARFVVSHGENVQFLPVYTPFLLQQLELFIGGVGRDSSIPDYSQHVPVDRPKRLE